MLCEKEDTQTIIYTFDEDAEVMKAVNMYANTGDSVSEYERILVGPNWSVIVTGADLKAAKTDLEKVQKESGGLIVTEG